MQQRVIACHLLNDFSGSPKVLAQSLDVLSDTGFEVHLFTSQNTQGFLSDLNPAIQTHHNWYLFHKNNWIRLLYYATSQVILFFQLLFFLKKKDVVYLNTVLPFGGALAAKCRGSKVIYHIHETTINPPILKSFLLKVIKSCSHHNIYVSEYVRSSHDLASIEGSLIYNALDVNFLNKAIANRKPKNEANKILMVCSLKAYKGVFEFIELAKIFPKQAFNLILNASKNEVDLFFDGTSMPSNLTIFDAQKDLHPFYESADMILNLSKPDGWIETFGLTIIEGMAYGLPAMVPTVGGITEVIVEDVTGFSADSRKLTEVAQKLALLIENPEMYQKMSNASIARLVAFDPATFKTKITNLFFRISNS